jgi:hypothetical protein
VAPNPAPDASARLAAPPTAPTYENAAYEHETANDLENIETFREKSDGDERACKWREIGIQG